MCMKQKRNAITSLPTKKQVETERKRYRRQKAYSKALGGTLYVLTIVAAVAVLIATLVLPVLQIEGTSMEPTLVNGDIVLLTKTTNFERGELCGFSWNNKLLIKRVIGKSGDWIEIDTDGTVYLNAPVVSLGKLRPGDLFNLDMIADNNPELYCEVSKEGMEGFAQFEKINTENGYFKALDRQELAGNSDHYPFAQRNVPCIFFMNEAGDAFKYYHTIYDTWKNAIFDNYEPTVRLIMDFIEKY